MFGSFFRNIDVEVQKGVGLSCMSYMTSALVTYSVSVWILACLLLLTHLAAGRKKMPSLNNDLPSERV